MGNHFFLLPWQEADCPGSFWNRKSRWKASIPECLYRDTKEEREVRTGSGPSHCIFSMGMGRQVRRYMAAPMTGARPLSFFDVAKRMVEKCPALLKRSKIAAATKRIVNYRNAGFYQVLSAETGTKHGLNISGLVFDEIHAQPNRKLYDVMTKGSGDAREQPLFFIITTAGTDKESICYELHTKALDIMNGRKSDPSFLPGDLRPE